MKASLPFKYIISAKNGKQYVVFDFKDINGKRKRKWVGTNLPEKCTKKALRQHRTKIVRQKRSQIFRQIVQKFCRHTVVWQKISVQDDGKDTSL